MQTRAELSSQRSMPGPPTSTIHTEWEQQQKKTPLNSFVFYRVTKCLRTEVMCGSHEVAICYVEHIVREGTAMPMVHVSHTRSGSYTKTVSLFDPKLVHHGTAQHAKKKKKNSEEKK